ncbi:MAG TPA: hypothetical protein VK661_11370 [Planctomycetota bacterium]|nr:hypothetical protein [Planctomycetota bacterium]
MPSTAPDAGEFSLLIVEADPAMVDEAAESLAEAFHLDPAVAQQVIKAAPIVFARGLTKHEVKAIIPKLVDLSKMGIELRITARPTGQIPSLHWPIRPQFTAANSGGAHMNPAFDWSDTAFVCPSCREAFLFKRIGRVPLGDNPADNGPTAKGDTDFVTPPVGSLPPLSKAVEEASVVPPSHDPADQYSVSLSKIADPSRADKAAELIAKYKGIPLPEARNLTTRLVIPIARNISLADAQQILEDFKRHRIFGRMSKVK